MATHIPGWGPVAQGVPNQLMAGRQPRARPLQGQPSWRRPRQRQTRRRLPGQSARAAPQCLAGALHSAPLRWTGIVASGRWGGGGTWGRPHLFVHLPGAFRRPGKGYGMLCSANAGNTGDLPFAPVMVFAPQLHPPPAQSATDRVPSTVVCHSCAPRQSGGLNFSKAVRYSSRQALAQQRPRVKGQFISSVATASASAALAAASSGINIPTEAGAAAVVRVEGQPGARPGPMETEVHAVEAVAAPPGAAPKGSGPCARREAESSPASAVAVAALTPNAGPAPPPALPPPGARKRERAASPPGRAPAAGRDAAVCAKKARKHGSDSGSNSPDDDANGNSDKKSSKAGGAGTAAAPPPPPSPPLPSPPCPTMGGGGGTVSASSGGRAAGRGPPTDGFPS
jgi:hypothetical protein